MDDKLIFTEQFFKKNKDIRRPFTRSRSPMPMTDFGFMQLRKIEDFDGHTWEIFFIDPTKIPDQH